jgi:hypothetical protein
MVIFKSLTKELLSKHPNRIFVETGTQYGYGIEVAIECGFEKIYSIDIDSKYHFEATKKFEKEIEEGRVQLFIGDSATFLERILTKVNEPATFWLDAHADAGIIGKSTCPVTYELDQIAKHHIKTHTLLIDDRRMFGVYWGVGTSEQDVIDRVKQVNPKYEFSYADGCEPNDIIVAKVPNEQSIHLL